jgi:hypothetical protein
MGVPNVKDGYGGGERNAAPARHPNLAFHPVTDNTLTNAGP